jgi:hypothetical protein
MTSIRTTIAGLVIAVSEVLALFGVYFNTESAEVNHIISMLAAAIGFWKARDNTVSTEEARGPKTYERGR